MKIRPVKGMTETIETYMNKVRKIKRQEYFNDKRKDNYE